MHIGFDCRLPTYRMGGISQYAIYLLRGLAEVDREHSYTVFHSRKEKGSFLPEGATAFRRRDLWTPCHHSLERWSLAAELLPHRLDLFHSPDFIPPASGARRHIITVHDLNFLYYPQFLTPESRRYYSDQIAWAVAKADHISADSEATRQDLIERLSVPPDKVTTVHLAANPVYTADYPDESVEQTLKRKQLPRGFVLTVGTLEPRKNIPTLLRAYRQARLQQGLDAPLVIVGSKGWIYEEIFTAIEELGLSDCVRHLSDVGDVELAHLYRAAAVLALSSYYEGFGLPALEAMHGGCPVIASNRGSLPEVVGTAGLLLDPDDVDAWSEALWHVSADDVQASSMRQAGFEQSARFSWRIAAEMTLEIYRRSLAG